MMLDERIKFVLEDKLFVKEHLSLEDEQKLYAIISSYLENRTSLSTFIKNLDDTIAFYELIGVSYSDMIRSIMIWPAIMHADKNELVKKYLILVYVVNAKNGMCDRDNIVINHPKDLMTGFDTIYARVMHLSRMAFDGELRTEVITRRKLFKTTNLEFEQSYGLSKEMLLERYPVTEDVIESLKKHNMNKELVEKYESQGFGRRTA